MRKDDLVAQQQVDTDQSAVGQAEGLVQTDQASVENARLNLTYANVRSPIDGVAGVRLIDVGNYVMPTNTTGLAQPTSSSTTTVATSGIVVLTQIDPIAVFITLPQDNLADITTAMSRGEVPVEVMGRDSTVKVATGHVTALDNQINSSTATLRLKTEIRNQSRVLWPNEFVKARVLVDTAKNALVVASAAVQRGPTGSFVYVVDDQNNAKQVTVEVLRTVDTLTILKDGVKDSLQAAQSVVTEGQGQLRPGSPVLVTNGKPEKPAPSASADTGKGKNKKMQP
jgi:multidrug efflux system membrane fusion protein